MNEKSTTQKRPHMVFPIFGKNYFFSFFGMKRKKNDDIIRLGLCINDKDQKGRLHSIILAYNPDKGTMSPLSPSELVILTNKNADNYDLSKGIHLKVNFWPGNKANLNAQYEPYHPLYQRILQKVRDWTYKWMYKLLPLYSALLIPIATVFYLDARTDQRIQAIRAEYKQLVASKGNTQPHLLASTGSMPLPRRSFDRKAFLAKKMELEARFYEAKMSLVFPKFYYSVKKILPKQHPPQSRGMK